jgi:predicted transcriptional regulator
MANAGNIRLWRARGKTIRWISEKTGLTKDQIARYLYGNRHKGNSNSKQTEAKRSDSEDHSAVERPGLVLLMSAARRSTRNIASSTSSGKILRTEL